MFIITGSKEFRKVLGINQYMSVCENCGYGVSYQLVRSVSWFTFFWIPIFPYSFKYYLMCPSCEFGYKLKKKQAEELLLKEFGGGIETIK